MRKTLSSETRQFLVTSELWEIFLAKDQKDFPDLEKLQLWRQRRLEKALAMNGHEFSSQRKTSNEKGNLSVVIYR